MQTDCQPASPSLSTFEPIDTARLKRDLGMHRAAQVLADASRCRAGLSALPLTQLDADEREWFKQAARNCIEIFETVTIDREPDAVRAQRDTDAERRSSRLAQALESRLSIERSEGRVAASDRGHDLTSWQPTGRGEGNEVAHCRRCSRSVAITLGSEPVLSGSALTEGCLTAAEDDR